MGSALCVFLLALLNQHLTMHGESEKEKGIDFFHQPVASRWVGGGQGVKGEG